jgi:hypothetical protein
MTVCAIYRAEVIMISRMQHFIDQEFRDEQGLLKQGHEHRILYNFEGYDEIGVILRWKDGRLNDDGDFPAVEFQDCHTEHFCKGILHNDSRGSDGLLKPAIIKNYGEIAAYYINGRQVEDHE